LLVDFLQCLLTFLALGIENSNAFFQHFSLLALLCIAALNNQFLFLLPYLADDFLQLVSLFPAGRLAPRPRYASRRAVVYSQSL
jgi:hypothetical protein